MGKYNVKVGIIGGTGLEDIKKQLLKDETPSTATEGITQGCISGVPVALISRHGVGHKLNPSQVDYWANIDNLKSVGCTHILATTACGSLSESITPGQLVVPDSFIDRTYLRRRTMFDGSSPKYPGVCHVPMEPAFHPRTSNILVQAAKELSIDVKNGGTVVTIEGPRFSSKAESNLFRQWRCDLVNMTVCPEVIMAKEAGLLYASLAMATDYDCWKESTDRVCVTDVMEVFKSNVHKVTEILVKAVELIGKQNWDEDIDDLKQLIEDGNSATNH